MNSNYKDKYDKYKYKYYLLKNKTNMLYGGNPKSELFKFMLMFILSFLTNMNKVIINNEEQWYITDGIIDPIILRAEILKLIKSVSPSNLPPMKDMTIKKINYMKLSVILLLKVLCSIIPEKDPPKISDIDNFKEKFMNDTIELVNKFFNNFYDLFTNQKFEHIIMLTEDIKLFNDSTHSYMTEFDISMLIYDAFHETVQSLWSVLNNLKNPNEFTLSNIEHEINTMVSCFKEKYDSTYNYLFILHRYIPHIFAILASIDRNKYRNIVEKLETILHTILNSKNLQLPETFRPLYPFNQYSNVSFNVRSNKKSTTSIITNTTNLPIFGGADSPHISITCPTTKKEASIHSLYGLKPYILNKDYICTICQCKLWEESDERLPGNDIILPIDEHSIEYVILTSGHIFHWLCLEGWINTGRSADTEVNWPHKDAINFLYSILSFPNRDFIYCLYKLTHQDCGNRSIRHINIRNHCKNDNYKNIAIIINNYVPPPILELHQTRLQPEAPSEPPTLLPALQEPRRQIEYTITSIIAEIKGYAPEFIAENIKEYIDGILINMDYYAQHADELNDTTSLEIRRQLILSPKTIIIELLQYLVIIFYIAGILGLTTQEEIIVFLRTLFSAHSNFSYLTVEPLNVSENIESTLSRLFKKYDAGILTEEDKNQLKHELELFYIIYGNRFKILRKIIRLPVYSRRYLAPRHKLLSQSKVLFATRLIRNKEVEQLINDTYTTSNRIRVNLYRSIMYRIEKPHNAINMPSHLNLLNSMQTVFHTQVIDNPTDESIIKRLIEDLPFNVKTSSFFQNMKDYLFRISDVS